MINRMECTGCGRIHRQLTDGMVKFKQYAAEVIEDVIDGVISESDPIDYPCEGTMKHWHWWFGYNKEQMEGQIRSAGYRLQGFSDGFLKPAESLLEEIRKRVSPGWLGMICRIVNNTGGRLMVKPEYR